MWSQWKWLRNIWALSFLSPLHNTFPSSLIPVPASKINNWLLGSRTSTHGVFPPYFMYFTPGVGMDPLTPQNLTLIPTFIIHPIFWYCHLAGCALHPFFFFPLTPFSQNPPHKNFFFFFFFY